jgi:hypothetical protein
MVKDQTALLEELRTRQQTAQARLQEATQAFQAAQAAHNSAQATFQKAQQALGIAQQQAHGWNTAYAAVLAEEAERKQDAEKEQLKLPHTPTPLAAPVALPEPVQAAEQKSKTDIIRDLLRQSSHGMTPMEIWSHVQDQFKYRAYMYSVLKRLTDREELCVRRGKYSIRIVPQEVKEETATIQ